VIVVSSDDMSCDIGATATDAAGSNVRGTNEEEEALKMALDFIIIVM
jgi:hypothetical protein